MTWVSVLTYPDIYIFADDTTLFEPNGDSGLVTDRSKAELFPILFHY